MHIMCMPWLVQDGFPISCEPLGLITSDCTIHASTYTKFKNWIDTNRKEQGGSICDSLSKCGLVFTQQHFEEYILKYSLTQTSPNFVVAIFVN